MPAARYISIFTAITGLVLAAASCGGPADRIRETSTQEPSPTPTASERVMSGAFRISGAAANGVDPYSGVLKLYPRAMSTSFDGR